MGILITAILIIAATAGLLLIIAVFTKKRYLTCSEIIINEPSGLVFGYLKQIRNQDHFNKWIMIDPDMKKDFKGTDGTVGFVYAWNGNKEAGEGEQEIMDIIGMEKIAMEIRFKRPFAGIAHAMMATEALTESETKVTWSTSSTVKYPFNILIPMIIKMMEKDMSSSLITLKNILEKH